MSKESHQITKLLPKEFKELADSAIDHIGSILDNTNMRDWIYVMAYLAAVDLAYLLLKGINLGIYRLLTLQPRNPRTGHEAPDVEEKAEDIDYDALLKAMVAGYIVLKIDATDITSAIGKVVTLVKGF